MVYHWIRVDPFGEGREELFDFPQRFVVYIDLVNRNVYQNATVLLGEASDRGHHVLPTAAGLLVALRAFGQVISLHSVELFFS